MNHPTIDVEELLELADEAMASDDIPEAIAILKKANKVAPLRKDIRHRIASLLDGSATPVRIQTPYEEAYPDDDLEYVDSGLERSSGSRDLVGDIARRAFNMASEHKDRAGQTTRKLSNLLQHGLESWRTSWLGSRQEKADAEGNPSGDNVMFESDSDLASYLERDSFSTETDADEAEEAAPDSSRIVVKKPVSQKAARKNSRAAAGEGAEDVLAAGIDGLLEMASQMNRKKLLFAGIYTGMAVLIAVACYDTAKKFPGAKGTSGNTQVLAAGVGGAVAGDALQLKLPPLEQAQALAAKGDLQGAADILRKDFTTDLPADSPVRIEFASLLNQIGAKELQASNFPNSVRAYREAVQVSPSNSETKVLLANALFYYAPTAGDAGKKESLTEASKMLEELVASNAQDVRANRLLALVYGANNNKSKSQESWKRVKGLAPAGSDIYKEAESHLK